MLKVSGHRFLRSSARVSWNNRVINFKVGHRALGKFGKLDNGFSSTEVVRI